MRRVFTLQPLGKWAFFPLLCLAGQAADTVPAAAATNRPPLAIVENGDVIKVGDKIALLKSKRAVSFPAWVNQPKGVIEYAIVTRGGKVHEAMFATDVDPRDLHATALLLNVASEEIVSKPSEVWKIPPASAVKIEAAWTADGQEKKSSLADLVILRDAKGDEKKFVADIWCYNGSRQLAGGAFLASTGGSIVSIIFDPDALINNPAVDRLDDDIHFVNAARLPTNNTPVTITFTFSAPADKK